MSQRDDLKSAVSMSLSYVKQETIDPVKRLGGLLLWGVVASVLTAFGFVLVALGLLRLLQDETGSAFHGHLNWLPYLITLVVVGIVLAVTFKRIGKRGG
ncbi:MAG: phage holin family protein [Ferrimicrobium sp.]|uniref:Phage holin family protein n=1 Tax=Ferrimicrobium acidiphilum TaxID=121039 RepID=A0ABV3Y0T4_9ACTN|nr:phage holin family protein [Ferrimicrobium sp.]MCL5972845.1 phage holin family protein [Actinomycetota bacterium]